ncbi:MAG: hypothetical protein VYA36_04030, partial [Pseudomonadota bacterium]|nr:hypothetical protein [Pseudomonadota bacterium]
LPVTSATLPLKSNCDVIYSPYLTEQSRNASRVAAAMFRLATASPMQCNSNIVSFVVLATCGDPDKSASISVTPSLTESGRNSW